VNLLRTPLSISLMIAVLYGASAAAAEGEAEAPLAVNAGVDGHRRQRPRDPQPQRRPMGQVGTRRQSDHLPPCEELSRTGVLRTEQKTHKSSINYELQLSTPGNWRPRPLSGKMVPAGVVEGQTDIQEGEEICAVLISQDKG